MPRTPSAGPLTTWTCNACGAQVGLYVFAERGDVVCNGSRRHTNTAMTPQPTNQPTTTKEN